CPPGPDSSRSGAGLFGVARLPCRSLARGRGFQRTSVAGAVGIRPRHTTIKAGVLPRRPLESRVSRCGRLAMAEYGSQSMVGRLRRAVVRAPDRSFAEADPDEWHYAGRPELE